MEREKRKLKEGIINEWMNENCEVHYCNEVQGRDELIHLNEYLRDVKSNGSKLPVNLVRRWVTTEPKRYFTLTSPSTLCTQRTLIS